MSDIVVFEGDPLALLEQHGYLTETSCNLPDSLTYDQYVLLGWELAKRRKKVMWWIGEWILYGERVYRETYAQAALVTGLSEETLRNYVSTVNKVPVERRREELHFSHHQEVASLEPEAQVEWLDKAVVNGWNRSELRAHLKPIKGTIITPALRSSEEIEEAARDLIHSAKQAGDDYVVRRDSFIQLCAALGEEI